jgi:hypothetical protein
VYHLWYYVTATNQCSGFIFICEVHVKTYELNFLVYNRQGQFVAMLNKVITHNSLGEAIAWATAEINEQWHETMLCKLVSHTIL